MEQLREQLRKQKSCYFLEEKNENENAVEKDKVEKQKDAGCSVENAVQKDQVEKETVEKENPNAVQTAVDMKEDAVQENDAVQQPPSKRPRWRNLGVVESPAVERAESHGSLSQDTLPWDSSVMEDTDEA